MDIIVFDDDRRFLDLMKKMLGELNAKHQGMFNTPVYFDNEEHAIAYVAANKTKPIVSILDIMVGNKPLGFNIGTYVKQVSSDNIVVYVSDYMNCLFLDVAQKMLAFSFIFKDGAGFKDELEEILLKAHGLFAKQVFVIDGHCYFQMIKYSDIYYFQKVKGKKHVAVVHKNKDDPSVFKNIHLSTVMEKLDSRFRYAAKEYIVNTQLITEIDKEKEVVFFEHGMHCPFSKTRKKELVACLS